MPPFFQEALISQIPALRLLQQLGFTYLSPEECAVERQGRLGRVVLEKVLAGQLKRLNKISFKGREVAFSEENIAKGIEALRDIPFEGLVRTSEKVYDLLTLGKSLDQTIGEECLNPELIQAPSACIDYVITHEICHLKHPDHGPKFRAMLQHLCPDWKRLKERLEGMV